MQFKFTDKNASDFEYEIDIMNINQVRLYKNDKGLYYQYKDNEGSW